MPAPCSPPDLGAPSLWEGFRRFDFGCDGRPAILVRPETPAPGNPWLWRGEFFGAFASVDLALLQRGWHVACLACPNTFGSPETLDRWDTFYALLTDRLGLSRKPVLLGMSRGGLYVYRWAARHPDRVGLIYGDAPVCDIRSWPGGLGKGEGSPADWARFKELFGLSQEQALAWRGNPIDLLEPIARAGVPILHVLGDADTVVPPEENSAVLQRRYAQLGGRITVIAKPGVGHHPHSLAEPAPIIDHIFAHRLPD